MATLVTGERQPRSKGGVFLSPAGAGATDLQRFAAMCDFDPTTGCVIWTGATTAGHGNSARYGSFKYKGKRWASHRWAAIHIHGLDLTGKEAGHCCPNTGGRPNTLCVEHLQAQGKLENVAEGNRTRHVQPNDVRQFYLFVSLGLEPAPEQFQPHPYAVPMFEPPAWFTAARPDYVLPPLADVPF